MDERSRTEGAGDPVGTIGIVGAGTVGVAFALVFAKAGFRVRIQDPDAARRSLVPDEVAARMRDLRAHALVDVGTDEVLSRIAVHSDVCDVLEDAVLVQECAPEQLPLKRLLFTELERGAGASTILASASSFLTASEIAGDLATRGRCLVGHPGNPPHLIRVVEVVPAPFTDPEAVTRAAAFYRAAGLSPILVGREVEGFVYNRLQGALLREAYCLVRDGVATVDDIDLVVRDGLGLRWSVVGPFETVDLNTRGGIASHAAKMGPSYERMGAERGQRDPWTPDLVSAVAAARRQRLPLDCWEDRVLWRDRQMMELLALRNGKLPPTDR